MLVIDSAVRAAHDRRDLNVGIRYAVVRLAELLDPDTPFALAGCAYCDPVAAAAAFESAARDYLADPGVRHGTVLAASQLLSDALEQEGNLRAWYPGDLTRLLLFLARLRKVPAVKTVGDRQTKVPYHERATWVRQRLTALVDGSLARFLQAIGHPDTGYRARLLDAIATRLRAAPATERDWAELDHDLCYAAALLLGEGRDGRELARAVGRAVTAAPGADAAAAALREAVSGGPSCHEVALVLRGARSLARDSATALGVAVIDRERPAWTAGSPAAAGRALAAFLEDRAPAGECTPLLVRVEAWDVEHARARAVLAVEALCDQLLAQHPDGRFAVEPEALVLEVATGATGRRGSPRPAVREGRPPRYDNAAELLPFLRANALARTERSPVLRILHAWIALEYLARPGANGAGPARPDRPAFVPTLEAYLPPHLAGVAALAGLRGQLLASWSAARALALRSGRRVGWLQVEGWLGVSRGHPRSLARLVELLRALADDPGGRPEALAPGAPPPVAAALLLDVAEDVGPFVRRRLETLGRQFGTGSRLAKAAEAIQVRTLIAIGRLKLARHLAVHQGFNAAQASPPLALSAVQVLDSAFEVLRRWMRPDGQAGAALAEARRWHEGNLAAWRSVRDLELDADHLLHPERT